MENNAPIPLSNHNPSVTNGEANNDEEDILEKMKGDAIGETLYSERFVLKTILKLPNLEVKVSDDEEYEKDLCNLWDMTIESDVVKFLLDNDVLEIFAGIIKTTEDERLIEILVGIIGNMCCVDETSEKLFEKDEIIFTILHLIESPDALTLVQLMRFLTMIFTKAKPEIQLLNYLKKIDNVADKLGFILTSSTNTDLLEHLFEALYEILYRDETHEKYDEELCDIFEGTEFITGFREGFKQLFPLILDGELFDEDNILSKKEFKMITTFVEINCAFKSNSDDDLYDCISRIFNRFCNPASLFALTAMDTNIFETLDILLAKLDYLFDPEIYVSCIKMYLALDSIQKKQQSDEWETSSDDGCDNTKLIYDKCLKILLRMTGKADDEILAKTIHLSPLNEESTEALCDCFRLEMKDDPMVEEACGKLAKSCEVVLSE